MVVGYIYLRPSRRYRRHGCVGRSMRSAEKSQGEASGREERVGCAIEWVKGEEKSALQQSSPQPHPPCVTIIVESALSRILCFSAGLGQPLAARSTGSSCEPTSRRRIMLSAERHSHKDNRSNPPCLLCAAALNTASNAF